jgi:1-acyl-sn-glycerol-3-phosphate acyltransferase
MIITQIIYLVTFVYWVIAYSYLVLTPSILIKNDYLIKLVKKLSQTLTVFALIYGFKSEFYITNTQQNVKELINQNPNLVDIIICNHITTIDFLIILVYLRYLGITSPNFIMSYKVNYIVGFGLVMYANPDIKVFRNWELDQDNMRKQIGKFNKNTSHKKQVLIIFPEGTRFTEAKFKTAQEFSKSKGIPVYDNLLVPKARGLWFLINSFKKVNKLGRVWDLTLTIPSMLGKSAYIKDLIGKPIGPVYGTIKELKLDFNYEDLEIFKIWLFKNWQVKDNFMKYYKNFIYKKLHFDNSKYKHLAIISLVCLIFSLFLSKKYGRYYLLSSIIISYILINFNIF